MKNEKNVVKQSVLNKLLMYNYIKKKVWINYIFMVYITCFTFKPQINHMWFLKFKVSEVLCVTTLILYVIPILT
jgi:hypothetical protein